MANATVKKHHEPLIQIAKRTDMAGWKAWLIRIAAILIGFFAMSFVLTFLASASAEKTLTMGDVLERMKLSMFGRVFEGGKETQMWIFFEKSAVLLCLSLALAPAFKMKFWNCGAEGQALFGGLMGLLCMINLGGTLPEEALVPIVILASILGGALWAVIPAIFHAKYGTNETLFTLMMNYVATQLVAYCLFVYGTNSNVITKVKTGALPVIDNNPKLLNVIIVVTLTVLMFVYMKYSKQGYEISVVGESQNTARYIGINVKKVIVRTMLISGALCGVAGMLLVAGGSQSINTDTVGGQGFTAIMVAWMGKFNPFIIAVMSVLVVALQVGIGGVADANFLNKSYGDVMIGVVILCLVACEFFIQYSVKIRRNKKGGDEA